MEIRHDEDHFDYNDYNDYPETYDFSNYSLWNIINSTYFNENESCFCDAEEFTIKMFQTCIFCLIFLLGVAGNCLVIATFVFSRRFRLRSMTDVFLFHLALADLLLLLTLPLQAVDTHLGWIFPNCLCKVLRVCYAINTYSGLLLLACISVDRYIVVARAQQMHRLRSRIVTGGKVAAVAVWFVAMLLSLPEILYSGVLVSWDKAYCGMLKRGAAKMSTNGAIIAVFCLSFFIMVTCYSLIAQVLWEGNKNRRGKQWRRQRTLKLMVALVVVFLVFQLPYTVVLSRKWRGRCALLLEYITCTLAYSRCCLNPILYALVGVRFRNDVVRLMYDSGCQWRVRSAPQSVISNSMSPTSPALTVFSACSPASPKAAAPCLPSNFSFREPNNT
ncbi:LOW QUALITY PROTEIN: C-X-C chemokine receptor type 6-like [Gymnodraco acuticeps]|uniref:LOW QUALITY PROTEIN: C-X-C chemokine receptor type 6-like n=1 Tax=Gymnodraco acuticeps TaxID=8218 RepID=A0A6P8VC73_GYMAC|nr:LOW QUALITY PROTEIN: C-X-C chemokine receptor type 6-like [Gymnodraco acuticeps]